MQQHASCLSTTTATKSGEYGACDGADEELGTHSKPYSYFKSPTSSSSLLSKMSLFFVLLLTLFGLFCFHLSTPQSASSLTDTVTLQSAPLLVAEGGAGEEGESAGRMFSVLVLRHAEKPLDADEFPFDPHISRAGLTRALHLPTLFCQGTRPLRSGIGGGGGGDAAQAQCLFHTLPTRLIALSPEPPKYVWREVETLLPLSQALPSVPLEWQGVTLATAPKLIASLLASGGGGGGNPGIAGLAVISWEHFAIPALANLLGCPAAPKAAAAAVECPKLAYKWPNMDFDSMLRFDYRVEVDANSGHSPMATLERVEQLAQNFEVVEE